jgi:hypothetical protein
MDANIGNKPFLNETYTQHEVESRQNLAIRHAVLKKIFEYPIVLIQNCGSWRKVWNNFETYDTLECLLLYYEIYIEICHKICSSKNQNIIWRGFTRKRDIVNTR